MLPRSAQETDSTCIMLGSYHDFMYDSCCLKGGLRRGASQGGLEGGLEKGLEGGLKGLQGAPLKFKTPFFLFRFTTSKGVIKTLSLYFFF